MTLFASDTSNWYSAPFDTLFTVRNGSSFSYTISTVAPFLESSFESTVSILSYPTMPIMHSLAIELPPSYSTSPSFPTSSIVSSGMLAENQSKHPTSMRVPPCPFISATGAVAFCSSPGIFFMRPLMAASDFLSSAISTVYFKPSSKHSLQNRISSLYVTVF